MAKRSADSISPIPKQTKKAGMEFLDQENLLDKITSIISEVRDDLLRGQSVTVESLCEEFLDTLKAEISGLKTDLGCEVGDLSAGLSKLSDTVDENRKLIESLAQRIQFLEEENAQLKGRQVDSENRDKCSNLLIQGVSESIGDSQLEDEFHRICHEHLNISRKSRKDSSSWNQVVQAKSSGFEISEFQRQGGCLGAKAFTQGYKTVLGRALCS